MITKKFFGIAFTALTMSLCSNIFAHSLKERVFKGRAVNKKGRTLHEKPYTMLLREAPGSKESFHIILAQYGYAPVKPTELAITVPKMYAFKAFYQVNEKKIMTYNMHPLTVTKSGQIIRKSQIDSSSQKSVMKIYKTAAGAVMPILYLKEGNKTKEIRFYIKPHSTWEDYVPGVYAEGNVIDYFRNSPTAVKLPFPTTSGRVEETATFSLNKKKKKIIGDFKIIESKEYPGMFVFRKLSRDAVGARIIENKIAVFIDIVNWKKKRNRRGKLTPKTTDEMLTFSPNNPKDVGIWYEKEDRVHELK